MPGVFHFGEPRWLWLAVIGPVMLGFLYGYAARERQRQLVRLASPHFLGELTAAHSPARRRFKEICLMLAVVFAGFALARPQWGSVEISNNWLGEDVVFVMDCSLSMTTTDVQPSRLQRAKFAVLDFVRRQSHGRVGLVAFAGSAFIQCPLTFDADAFEESLLSLDEKTMPIAGTDIGRALDEAYQAMDKNSRRKMVILVTDGEDLEKSGVVAAKHLATNGVVVFAIGVGTPAGKEIQIVNAAGQPELLHDAKGEIVQSRLDETTLREIAEATGGSYFPLGPLGDGLMKVRSAIHALDMAEGLRLSFKNGVDRFYWPLAVVLILLVSEPLIGTRAKTGSYDAMKILAPTQILALAVVFASGLSARAGSDTNGTLAPAPVTAREFYNAGTELLAAKKFDDAEKMFQGALASQDERVQPAALYNVGNTRFLSGLDRLKKGPDAQKVASQGEAALAASDRAMEHSGTALAGNNLNEMIGAYLEGRGARHNLREAEKAVSAAMETYGKTLEQWLRAADDFKGAKELNPADTNAAHNAEIAERGIAKLVDSLRKMREMMGAMGKKKQDLGKMMSKLKGQIPAPNAPPGQAGEDDDDEQSVTPDSLAGKEEGPGRQGQEMRLSISPNEASQILNGLSLDGTRRLDMSDKQGGPIKDRKGRNW